MASKCFDIDLRQAGPLCASDSECRCLLDNPEGVLTDGH
jgi:hypothetical protein